MNASDIGIAVSRKQFADYVDSVRGGQFIHLRGYVNADGEKADYTLRFGIRYGDLKARDVRVVQDVLAGSRTLDLHVTHGVWIPTHRLATIGNPATAANAVAASVRFQKVVDGTAVKVEVQTALDLSDGELLNTRKSGDRTQATISYRLPSTHPAAKIALQAVLDGFLNPKPATADYAKEGKSLFSLDTTDRWYLRDVLAVSKVVTEQAVYDFKASATATAIKDACRRHLLTGKYRQFILTDGNFTALTIDGQAVCCDGVDEEFYFALPENVREAVRAEAVA